MICMVCGHAINSGEPFGHPRNHEDSCSMIKDEVKDEKPATRQWIPRHDTYFDVDY